MLRDYLAFAASGGTDLGEVGGSGETQNAFEGDIFEALSAEGIPLIPQYGVSRYRLDFAAQHPEKPGLNVMAIECDGASYHSSTSARDRDRLRQQQLAAMGWRFHRIWSTDWMLHRARSIQEAVQAWEDAVRSCNERHDPDRKFGGLFDNRGSELAHANPAPIADFGAQVIERRGPMPRVSKDFVTDPRFRRQLAALVRWIKSDGLLRTDEELVDELMRATDIRRRGKNVMLAFRAAIADAK